MTLRPYEDIKRLLVWQITKMAKQLKKTENNLSRNGGPQIAKDTILVESSG